MRALPSQVGSLTAFYHALPCPPEAHFPRAFRRCDTSSSALKRNKPTASTHNSTYPWLDWDAEEPWNPIEPRETFHFNRIGMANDNFAEGPRTPEFWVIDSCGGCRSCYNDETNEQSRKPYLGRPVEST